MAGCVALSQLQTLGCLSGSVAVPPSRARCGLRMVLNAEWAEPSSEHAF